MNKYILNGYKKVKTFKLPFWDHDEGYLYEFANWLRVDLSKLREIFYKHHGTSDFFCLKSIVYPKCDYDFINEEILLLISNVLDENQRFLINREHNPDDYICINIYIKEEI